MPNDAGVDSRLRILDLLSSGDPSGSLKLAFETEREEAYSSDQAGQYVLGCPESFYQGAISCQRVLDVVVFPFIKLARRVDEDSIHSANSLSAHCKKLRFLLEAYHSLWGRAFMDLGNWAKKESQKTPSVVLEEKYSELVKALLDAKIPEVSMFSDR